LDTVRDGQFIPELDLAVTVSEDCTVKLWDLKNIDQQDKSLTENIKYNFIDDGTDFAGDSYSFYSYCTLRGHTGIVTKVAVGPSGEQGTLMYTAGIEGIVRVWKVPESVKEFEQNDDLSSKL
jgi:WD40 repeat protein